MGGGSSTEEARGKGRYPGCTAEMAVCRRHSGQVHQHRRLFPALLVGQGPGIDPWTVAVGDSYDAIETIEHCGSTMPEPDVGQLLAGTAATPIVVAPMAGGPSVPELVAAVSRSGAFGILAAGYKSADGLLAEIQTTRHLTDAPFGVNVFVPGPDDVDGAELASYLDELSIDAGRLEVPLGTPVWDDDAYASKIGVLEVDPVAVVSFTFGSPDDTVVDRLHAVGTQVVVTVTAPQEAVAAEAAGADALAVQGAEAGGHQGRFRNDDAALMPQPLTEVLASVRAVATLPMLAAGGIMTGGDISAVIDAGAVAAQLGTAFLAAPEAGTGETHRSALVDPRFTATTMTRAFTGRAARGIRNRFIDDHPSAPAAYPQIHHATRPLRSAAAARGDSDDLHLWAGVGFRRASTDPAEVIVQRLVRELRSVRDGLDESTD